eukprot:TRINITY_DN2913_c0_g2_i5.p1 TRINITY_DN2913_c0_g2~~TRINITY_DN2913_c0_g2_i5.p1  ORF type:complete len:867 (-),score=220.48 TRINITY_DN2913_c0_g2_i5:132-2732(-)
MASFEVEYPVAVHENLKSAKGPYTLELLRTPYTSLGLSLIGSPIPGGPIIVSSIKPGSISDRTGALHVGDQIISINGKNVQGLSVLDSSKLLQVPSIRVSLELLPDNIPYQTNPFFNKEYPRMSNSDSMSQLNSSVAEFGLRPGALSAQSIRSTMTLQRLPARQETLIVQLNPTLDGYGIGIDSLSHPTSGHVVITNIEFNSPAYQCGVLMEGDHILTVNDRPVHSAVQCQQLLQESLMQNRILDLLIELDVNEAVTPSSGTFSIKLMRSGLPSLGVTLNGPVQGERGAIWIAKIKKGGVAYRSGGLQIGDVLLEINGQSLSHCTLSDAVHLLQEPDDLVTLKISKETQLLGPRLSDFNSITYTVELPKDKGNLGISIRGTSTAGSSVVVSHLMEGGVASRTEAIHVGDEILSINGVSVKDKTLLNCANMLEEAEIVVALQIRKPDPFVKGSMLAQQDNIDYHVQCAVATPVHDPRDAVKQIPQPVAATQQTNGPPPIRAKPQLHPATSYPVDSYRLAQEAALRGRGRRHPNEQSLEQNPVNPHFPRTDFPNRKSTDLHSTSLTNITHMDRGSSIDSDGSSMYNSSPSPPQKKTSRQPRETSNLTKFVAGTTVPIRMHRSVEVLPNVVEVTNIDQKKTNKSRTMERGRTGLGNFTPVHETDELGVYSIPLDEETHQEVTGPRVPSNTSAPALPRRNQIPVNHSPRPSQDTTWLDVPTKQPPPQPRLVASLQTSNNYVTLNTNTENGDINPGAQIQHRLRQPSFDSNLSKNSNQEVTKVKLQKMDKQSFGFSISDGTGNMGVFVKNVDCGSVAERGNLKPLDKLLAINGISIKELNCDKTLKLLKSSDDNLELVVSRLHLSSKNQTL